MCHVCMAALFLWIAPSPHCGRANGETDAPTAAKPACIACDDAPPPRATNSESLKVPQAAPAIDPVLNVLPAKPAIDTVERIRCASDGGNSASLESQPVIIGPLPLSKLYCPATHAEDGTDAKTVERLPLALESLEVYVIDKKTMTRSGDWVFANGPENYPKILLANPFSHNAVISGLSVELASQSAGLRCASDRQVRICITMSRGTPFYPCWGSGPCYTDMPENHYSDIITYNVDGKIQTNPAEKCNNFELIFPMDVKEHREEPDTIFSFYVSTFH